MAEGDGTLYNNFKEALMEKQFNMATAGDTIQVILVSAYTPNIDTHDDYLDVSGVEYGAGLGYTVKGETLGSQDVTQDDANDRGVFDGADVTWTSLGPLSPATPSDAIMFDDSITTPLADLLMAYWELGVTATNGGNYTLSWPDLI
jgi:hypothetical protein